MNGKIRIKAQYAIPGTKRYWIVACTECNQSNSDAYTQEQALEMGKYHAWGTHFVRL